MVISSTSARLLYILSVVSLLLYIITTLADIEILNQYNGSGLLLILFFLLLALAFRGHELLKGYSFTIMIFAAVSAAMYYPQYFTNVGDFKLSKLIVPLMQIIMFGMGTGLSMRDFARVVRMPKGVIAGVLCHYLIMPLVAFGITRIFQFPDEIAAGIILIGSCPNGLASNVMTYLARANLALSVTLTAISTFIAPFVTPFFMSLLAGQYVEIDFWAMVWDITKIVIIPVTAGLVFNYFLHGKFKWLDEIMPVISMGGIALIIVVITSAGRDSLLEVGPKLIAAVIMHNMSGYVLGYLSARTLRMKERDCRTIAIEVGLQNAGLGSSLALALGKLSTVGLAAAVFAPVMNITGSSLALWFRNKPLPQEESFDSEEVVKHA
ncbi:bile acid:sodium symporter family protein [Chryseosolibacter indicus]|uniref:Bile acid:sodium symporter family protein n=1 Tax=Chryseosolibacter indicus TaxID=2782351 RepID=A0ABS5VKI5_9BACT|nr:bile acid:sodium symporter family protein [Chryseosolibacter indicus]MBT1701958.1 bile acid:sodium symporter family protein [Chryseosolibacter indicus]